MHWRFPCSERLSFLNNVAAHAERAELISQLLTPFRGNFLQSVTATKDANMPEDPPDHTCLQVTEFAPGREQVVLNL